MNAGFFLQSNQAYSVPSVSVSVTDGKQEDLTSSYMHVISSRLVDSTAISYHGFNPQKFVVIIAVLSSDR
jgi:hypothetical protein